MTKEEALRPFAKTKTAQFIDGQIERLKRVKSQRDIALAAGYNQPNMLSMIKRGETKMPLDKIPALAKAIDADPAHLLRMALEDYLPALGAAFDNIIGHVATENEWTILLRPWRRVMADSDPAPNPEIDAAVERMLRELLPREGPMM